MFLSFQILTFDEGGITGNPHHKALSAGVAELVSSPSLAAALAAQPAALRNPTAPRRLVLRSRSWARNLGLFTPIVEHAVLGAQALRSDPAKMRAEGTRVPTYFVSDVKGYIKAWKALLNQPSQMGPMELALWVLGRSMWINEWVEV